MEYIEHEAPEEDAFNYVYRMDGNDFIFFVKHGRLCYIIPTSNNAVTKWLSWPDKKDYFLRYLNNSFIHKLDPHNRFKNVPPMPILSKVERKIKIMHERSAWGQKREGVAYV